MKFNRMNRRAFLQGIGGFTLSIPVLPSLLPKAEAQMMVSPKRFIALKSHSAQLIDRWYPAQATPGYRLRAPWSSSTREDGTLALNNLIPGTTDHRWALLQDFAINGRGISDLIDNRFNSLLSKMMLIRGLDLHCDANHNGGGMLGNFAAGIGQAQTDYTLPFSQQGTVKHRPTIDQIMAYSRNFYPNGNPTGGSRSLSLAVCPAPSWREHLNYTSFGDPNRTPVPVTTILNPRQAFDQVFGTTNTTPPPTTGVDPNTPLLNLVFEDFQRVRNGRAISSQDRSTLDNYMDRLTDLINGMQNNNPTPVAACTPPTRPPSIQDAYSGTAVRESHRHMTDILIAAILCGHTNIATLDVRSGFDRATGIGSPHGGDVPNQWHGSAHRWSTDRTTEAMRQLFEINKWIADTIFYRLAHELNQVADPAGGTILDNSIVYWGNELGFNHLTYSVPAITAGGAGGFFQTGRYFDYIQWNYSGGKFSQDGGHTLPGITQNRFLVALLQAMGIPQSEYQAFNHGEPGYGTDKTTGYSVGQGGHANWNMALNGTLPPGMTRV